ncbi:competence protein CoiA family protein [Nocardiopsis algeriensis]|uniref:competence protein CoiA family protein n=1 Tax=Nocardiopsis algeriensis TaxID=1478215 RepID=UPI003B438BB1
MDRQEALEFKTKHPLTRFWCGKLLGGCGGPLTVKVYSDRVAHFAHRAGTNECTRQHGGIESADHLYAGKQVSRWLRAQGLPQRRLRFDGDFENGGICHRATLPATEDHPAITFEFTRSLGPELVRLVERTGASPTTLLAQDNPPLIRRFVGSHGHALCFRMRTERLERVMDIGVVSSEGPPAWYPITDFSLGPEGLAGPGLPTPGGTARPLPRTARRLPGTARRTPASPPASDRPVEGPLLLQQLMTGLDTCLDRRDRASVRHFADRLTPYLSSGTPEAVRHRARIRELLTQASRLLGASAPRRFIMEVPANQAASLSVPPKQAKNGSTPRPVQPEPVIIRRETGDGTSVSAPAGDSAPSPRKQPKRPEPRASAPTEQARQPRRHQGTAHAPGAPARSERRGNAPRPRPRPSEHAPGKIEAAVRARTEELLRETAERPTPGSGVFEDSLRRLKERFDSRRL